MAREDADAYLLLERLRWGGPPGTCPQCGAVTRCYFLGDVAGRRIWKCGSCRRQFSVLVGTILQGTRTSLWTWIGVVGDWQRTGRLPAPTEISERYGLTVAASRQLRKRLEHAGRLIGRAG